MYCCSSTSLTGCRLDVVENEIIPDCKVHHVPSFKETLAKKASSKFLSTNKPVKCQLCSGSSRKPQDVFVPKYNMLEHYKKCHKVDYDKELGAGLDKYINSDEEKSKVTNKFWIKDVE